MMIASFMIGLRKYGGLVCVMMLLLIPSSPAVASDPAAQKAKLTQELADVRAQIENAQSELSGKSKDIWKQQHDLEYNDPAISRIRSEIVELEKQLIAKRAELQAKLQLLPGMKQVEAERRDLFLNLQKLRETERVILNEIAAVENAGHQSP